MLSMWVLLFLIFISAIPAAAVYIWFRIIHYPFPLVHFLFSLLAGAAAFFPALILQNFFPSPGNAFFMSKWALFTQNFFRVALTEELSRLILFLPLLRILNAGGASGAADDSGPALSYNAVVRGTAAGLVAGLGFAVIESAAYGASNAEIVLIRIFTSAPLHGACGSRVGAAVTLLRTNIFQGVFRFFSAVAIHGIYNFMIILPGFPAIAAILIALSALVSSILSIRTGAQGLS